MVLVELDGIFYNLPSNADEVAGTCKAYDPPTDPDGGCLRLKENRAPRHPEERDVPRQRLWVNCKTNPDCRDEGKCPFVD